VEVRNHAGANHSELTKITDVLQACTSEEFGAHTSSGLGLQNAIVMCESLGSVFNLQVTDEEVIATCTIPEATHITRPSAPGLSSMAGQQQTQLIALLVLDDQKLLRKQGMVLYKALCMQGKSSDQVERTRAMWEANAATAACATEDLLVIGLKPPDISEIHDWIRNAVTNNMHVIGVIDQNLEYEGGVSHRGSDVIAELRTLTSDLPHAILVVRSGNDSAADNELYICQGADRMISKTYNAKMVVSMLREMM